MRYKSVIFDLDGTLLNTAGDLTASVNAALAVVGAQPLDEWGVMSRTGNGIRKLIELSAGDVGEAALDKMFHTFMQHYRANYNVRTRPYDGISEVVSSLYEAGVPIGVVSNKKDELTNKLISEHFGAFFPSGTVCGERAGLPRKPDPLAMQAVFDALGAAAEECVYVGDTEVDANTAKNCGMGLIMVSWGFRSRETLEAAGYECIVDTAEELMKAIEG